MTQVFISYSRKDLSFVERLASDLKNAGFEVWYDLSSLGGGTRWGREIEAGIKKSRYVIVVLSPASVVSEWVEREFLFASNRKRKIIPLLYRPCELPINYLDLNYIDVQGENYQQNFDELLEALDVDPTKLSSPAQATPSKLPFGLQTRQVALIGTVAAFLILAGIFLFSRDWGTVATEPPAPIVTTITSEQPPPDEPSSGDITPATEATPTPSPTPTNTATPTNTPSPTPTNTATLITPTTEPSPSAYTTSPPSIDGYLSITYKGEWKDARLATMLPLDIGNLYYLNDDQYLYLLVDVTEDNKNDLYENNTKSYDDLTIGFNVDQDNKQDLGDVYYKYSGRDVIFKSFVWSDVDQKGCGAEVTELHTFSAGVSGFDISPEFGLVSHKFWELKIDLEDIKGRPGEIVYAGVFLASYERRPFTFDDSVPKGFGFDGFCTYDNPIKIYLHTKP